MTYYKVVEIASTYSIFILIVIGCIKIRLRHATHYFIFLLWLLCSGFFNLLNAALVVGETNNMFSFHVYTLLELTCLLFFYREILYSSLYRRATMVCLVAFFVFKGIDILYITGLRQVDAWAITIESIIVITFSLLYFAQLPNKSNFNSSQNPLFWINAGILVYFSTSFFIFLFSTPIFGNTHQYYTYWSVHDTAIITRDILFALAMITLNDSSTRLLLRR